MKPTRQFPCSKCGTLVPAFPGTAARIHCGPCLRELRSLIGIRNAAARRPAVGATKLRRFLSGQTYRVVYMPDHPHAPKGGWCMEHRLVMERVIGRLLEPAEIVHHEDRNGLNNAPENLTLIESKGRHLADEHCMEGVAARMNGYPICGCGKRTAYGETVCWPCWSKSQECPTCRRPGRKMATRDMCHGCYKALRRREGRIHKAPKSAN